MACIRMCQMHDVAIICQNVCMTAPSIRSCCAQTPSTVWLRIHPRRAENRRRALG